MNTARPLEIVSHTVSGARDVPVRISDSDRQDQAVPSLPSSKGAASPTFRLETRDQAATCGGGVGSGQAGRAERGACGPQQPDTRVTRQKRAD